MNTYKNNFQKTNNQQECYPKCPNQIYIIGNNGLLDSTGPTGPQGLNGATGPAPTLTIGTVTTGAPGTAANVTITPTV